MDFIRLFFFFLDLHDSEKMPFWYFERSEERTEEDLTVWFAKIETKLKQFFLIGFYIPS